MRVRPAAALADCTAIYHDAFSDDSVILSATIPGNIKVIGESAFDSCTNLSSVTIENGVESVETLASLEIAIAEITIPSSVTTMGYAVFGKNSQITMMHCMHPSKPAGWNEKRANGYTSGSSPVPYEWIG